MNLLDTMGLISTIALFAPVLLLLVLKLAWYKSFPALFAYYLILLSYNLLSLNYFGSVGEEILTYHKVLNHLLEVPLLLFFFTYFSKTANFRKRLLVATYAFVAFEIAVVAMYGFTIKAITIVLAPGLLAILVLSSMFFIHQVKIAVIYHKAVGKAVMIACLLFAFAGYSFVYVVNHLVETPYMKDVYLVYFLITIITSIPMAIGVYFERLRVQHLEEIQTTREELKKIYGEEGDASGSLGTVALFDKEQWN
jgi:hypothetical protein